MVESVNTLEDHSIKKRRKRREGGIKKEELISGEAHKIPKAGKAMGQKYLNFLSEGN